jgi:hypothetical protein
MVVKLGSIAFFDRGEAASSSFFGSKGICNVMFDGAGSLTDKEFGISLSTKAKAASLKPAVIGAIL